MHYTRSVQARLITRSSLRFSPLLPQRRFPSHQRLAPPHDKHTRTAIMDGIRPQKNRQQAKRTAQLTSGGWSSNSSGGGLPGAPGSALDAELVRQTLATTSSVSRLAPQAQPHAASAQRASKNSTAAAPAQRSAPSPGTHTATIAPQPFDVYVVLDFEATCERNVRLADPEVIEFPMVLVDARTATPIAEFQRYVKPVRHPVLSAFCTELTGITQDMVDGRDTFPTVYKEALDFLASAGLGDAPPLRSYCVVTCGDWDLKVMLPAQMSLSGHLGVPASFTRWCNLKKCIGQLGQRSGSGVGGTPSGMPEMLKMVGLPLQGRHHSGIDDCRNIAAVLCALLRRGHVVNATFEASPPAPRWHATASVTSGEGVPLPALDSVASSLADGAAASIAVAGTAPEAPPRAQARTEKPQERPHPSSTASPVAASGSNRRFLLVDGNRDAVAELLGGSGAAISTSASVVTPADHKTVSKFLSTLLRHKADQWRVPITANGYVLVEDALRQPQVAKRRLTAHDVAVLVRDSDKQRFRLAYGAEDGRLYIAAAQGHSLAGVEPELRAVTDAAETPVAVHGTYWPAWRLIEACGYMSPMTRQHIHFAKGLMHDDGVISGMRKDVQVFIYLDVPALLADGVPLLESSNGVLLTPGVGDSRQLPLRYVAKVVDRQTGRKIYPPNASE